MREKEKKHKGVTRLLRRGTPGDERTLLHLGIGTAAWAFVGLGSIPSETVAIAMFALAWMCISLFPKDYKALLYFASVSVVLIVFPSSLSLIPIIALCIGDAAAGYFGDGNGTKSWKGWGMCYSAVWVTLWFVASWLGSWNILFIALTAAFVEKYSGDYDNFFVPASVAWLILWLGI
jgi:hypothetical protein